MKIETNAIRKEPNVNSIAEKYNLWNIIYEIFTW